MRKDPVFEALHKKQKHLNEESRLIPKTSPSKPIIIGTSIVLGIGVLIGLIRILIVTMS